MMNFVRYTALAAVFFALYSADVFAETLSVKSGDQSHAFEIEIADDSEEITRGLMFRESLAPDAGMLFDFGAPREANMWMKNVTIPLDMLFLSESGEIISIAHKAVPGSERRINPGVVVKGVLELNGGRAAELGIKPGDMVEHTIFEAAEPE